MARITPLYEKEFPPSVKIALERHLQQYNGGISNMKATLGYSLAAFEACMQWYPLYEEAEKILGKRLAYFYAYAVSSAAECIVCTAFFRKIIMDNGEKPERPELTDSQKNLLDFGRSVARHRGNIADHLYNVVAVNYSPGEMVLLVAFTSQMIATSIFNNVLETDIDEYLVNYLPPVKYC
jgi:hypothetical protein